MSHPTGVRGLKSFNVIGDVGAGVSHPTGVRGLKYPVIYHEFFAAVVAPHWGAWIEITQAHVADDSTWSHPTGVRGLKLRRSGGTR